MLADDTTCFLQGDLGSFQALFSILDKFVSFSGCKINLSKPEAIHKGSLKGTDFCPFEEALRWRTITFKTLGINFSLNINSLHELNFIPKLHQIEQTLTVGGLEISLSLSLLGKVNVIKFLLLLQLLFSVLCINIPKIFFKKLSLLFYKFIWNGSNDRVKRDILCNDYEHGGLRMIDLHLFSYIQKSTWVKQLLDPAYTPVFGKFLEMPVLENFHPDWTILFRTDVPNCILNTLIVSLLRLLNFGIYTKAKLREI